jgi:putative hemolysin
MDGQHYVVATNDQATIALQSHSRRVFVSVTCLGLIYNELKLGRKICDGECAIEVDFSAVLYCTVLYRKQANY